MDKQNSSSSESKNWGGARKGAGRKSVEHGKCYTFRSTPAVDAILSTYEGKKNSFINEAIEHYYNSKH